jgi:hypothetical protein
MNSPIVCRALVSEVPVLAGTLQAAFDGYPWTNWAFPADNRAARLCASFALYLTASINGLAEVWTGFERQQSFNPATVHRGHG